MSCIQIQDRTDRGSNPRHERYTEGEIAHHRAMAEEAAVQWPDLGGPSNYATRWTRTNRPPRTLILDPSRDVSSTRVSDELPSLALGIVATTFDKQPPSKPTQRADVKPQKSARDQRTINLVETSSGARKKGTRRGRKQGSRERPVAGYWSPLDKGYGGGKSMSTLWGYGLGMSLK